MNDETNDDKTNNDKTNDKTNNEIGAKTPDLLIEQLAKELYDSSRGYANPTSEDIYPDWESLQNGKGSSNVENIRTKYTTLAVIAFEFFENAKCFNERMPKYPYPNPERRNDRTNDTLLSDDPFDNEATTKFTAPKHQVKTSG